ncbi:MAG TPA: molybdopterin-dependent oxidoreductase, partial [Mycobacterium sp.]|nr:molybdopterin-dependent oxidoreductase [Mycobacterium sp.]
DLARLVGASPAAILHAVSLQPPAANHQASLAREQWRDKRALLALRVNGVDLSADHGYPARIIVPALPGVHNTKWVRSIEFGQP